VAPDPKQRVKYFKVTSTEATIIKPEEANGATTIPDGDDPETILTETKNSVFPK
jgi:hypothetical protein